MWDTDRTESFGLDIPSLPLWRTSFAALQVPMETRLCDLLHGPLRRFLERSADLNLEISIIMAGSLKNKRLSLPGMHFIID